MAQSMSQAMGEEIVFNDVPAAVYRSFGFPGAEELGNMFQIEAEHTSEVLAVRSIEASRKLNPDLQSFDTWLLHNKERIPQI